MPLPGPVLQTLKNRETGFSGNFFKGIAQKIGVVFGDTDGIQAYLAGAGNHFIGSDYGITSENGVNMQINFEHLIPRKVGKDDT
jgi:hypothetical protein